MNYLRGIINYYSRRRLIPDLVVLLVMFFVVVAFGVLQCILASQAGPITRSDLPLDSFSSLAEVPNDVSPKAAERAAEQFLKQPELAKAVEKQIEQPAKPPEVGPTKPALPPFWYVQRACQGVKCHVVIADPRRRAGAVSVQCAPGMPDDAEAFSELVRAAGPRAAVAGTYFSKTTLHPVGDIVVNGRQVHFGGFGTALVVGSDGDVEFRKVPWARHVDWSGYKTVLAAGPTLLRDGVPAVDPVGEGYRDPHVLGTAPRCAIGARRDGFLVVACVPASVTLIRLAAIMRELQCWDAMALDGGGSLCLYVEGQYVIRPSRQLTNVLTVGER